MKNQLKKICYISDSDALQIAIIALYDKEIEDFNDEDVWIGYDVFDNNTYRLQVGMRCFDGTLCINEATGEIYFLDTENERLKSNPEQNTKIIDFLIKNGYEINRPNT